MQRRRVNPPAGPLLGEDDGILLRVRGIRYGRAARFAAPQPLAPWTDVLFGTYHCPPHQHHVLGMPGFPKKSYVGWIARPHRDDH